MTTDVLSKATEKVESYRFSMVTYANDCLVIRNKRAEFAPLIFNYAQRIVHDKLSTQFREKGFIKAIILKARQEGISTYVAARFFRRCTLYSNQNALVIADQRKRGQVIFGIYENYNRKLPPWIKPEQKTGQTGTKITWDNRDGTGLGSSIQVETAKDAAAGRGSTLQSVHASEMAFWENPEEVWVAIQQAVPDEGSEVIIESTANGVGNMFHQMWEDAENGESDFIPIFLPWWIHEEYRWSCSKAEADEIRQSLSPWETKALNEGLDWEGGKHKLLVDQLAWRRRTIRNKLNGDERLFMQEYPATAEEAFLVSGDCFFDVEVLNEYKNLAVKPKRFRLHETSSGILRIPDNKGELWLWAKPSPAGEYVIFADTATGKQASTRESYYVQGREKGGRDFSCAWVYDLNSATFVAKLHGRIPPETFALKLNQLGYLYSNPHPIKRLANVPALIGVERNHRSGETVLRVLKKQYAYPSLYYDRQINKRLDRTTQSLGFVTTEAKRTVMLDEFSAALRAGEVVLPDLRTIMECRTFVRGEDGRSEAEEGCHDDRVIAAAGALLMAKAYHRPKRLKRGPSPEPSDSGRTDSPTGLFDYGEDVEDGDEEEG